MRNTNAVGYSLIQLYWHPYVKGRHGDKCTDRKVHINTKEGESSEERREENNKI